MFNIPPKIYQEIVDFARREKPNEACGILGGAGNRATVFYPVVNTEKSPVSYLMDLKELVNVTRNLRTIDQEMVAIFHSHPRSQAFPSDKDVELALHNKTYLILSLKDAPELRGFKIDRENGAIREVQINIET
ncbi:MAG: M67 family metallopeptidase [Desulfotomaculaceae bacterium]|nr:M67 family metallopeptidase [Desulfotomaculaceae bacterium]MDD4767548.1 M67 family metallopeptidase [Desulfotomaculaceae bacterium]